jgi:hypothetical protein
MGALQDTTLRAANVKRARSDTARDCCMADVERALHLAKLPFCFTRRRAIASWAALLKQTGGIYVALLSFLRPDNKVDKHYVGVDCWRGLIFDNCEKTPIPFAGRSSKELMKRIECAALERVWQCMVLQSRTQETEYI